MLGQPTSVILHKPARCHRGYTLLAPDHGRRVFLIGVAGEIVHEWRVPTVHFAILLPETPIGRRGPRFRASNVLISHRTISTIAVIERETGEVVWAYGPGSIDFEHHANMIADGSPEVYRAYGYGPAFIEAML